MMKNFQQAMIELWEDLVEAISTAFASKQDKIYLSIALTIGAFTRGYFLNQPMRYDESFSFLNFVNGDLSQLFYYPLPNNHVFHTVLVKLSVSLWGAHPISIRFPAFIAGLLIIPLTFIFSRILAGGKTGLISSIAVAVSPYIILYSTNARGYTLLILLSLLMALLGLFFVKKPSFSRVLVTSFVAALGMFTMPSMLYLIAGVFTWIVFLLFVKKWSLKNVITKWIIPVFFLTSFLTIILYLPVMIVSGGVETIVSNQFVISQPWTEFFARIPPHFRQTISAFCRDVPDIVVFVGAISLLIGLWTMVKEKNWEGFLLVPSLIVGAGIIFVSKHKIPFDRTWIYFLPFLLILMDIGIDFLNNKLPDRLLFFIPLVVTVFALFFSIQLISRNVIAQYSDTGTFSDAPIVVQYLKPMLDTDDKIYVTPPGQWPTKFYFWYYITREGSDAIISDRVNEFYVVRENGSIEDLTAESVKEIFVFDTITVYQKIDIAGQ